MKRNYYISGTSNLNSRPEDQIQNLIDDLEEMKANIPEFGFHVEIKTGQRTLLQNSAIHKYFELLANDLNSAGLDMKRTLKASTDIPWTAVNVKEHLWRPIQIILTEKESTKKLDRKEVSEVYEVLARHMSEKFGISTPFPQNQYPD